MKKFLKLSVCFLFACFLTGFLVSCPGASSSSDLPVQTINWESDGTNLEFYTNDVQYLSTSNSCWDTSAYYDLQTTSLTAYIKKNSGNVDYGYGLIFGKQNTSSDNYYRMNVTADGYIYVYKKVNGNTTTLKDWTLMGSNINFNKGYGVENKVQIWEDSTTDNKFWIVFNDSQYGYTIEDSGTVFNSGYVGVVASVGSSSYESFPNTPVDVRIRITSPVTMRSIGGIMESSVEFSNPDEVRKY